jgi:uncharacterized repeat protein (TIGR02543 family)
VNNDVYSINTRGTKRVRDKVDTYVNKLPLYIRTLESIAGKFPGESAGFVFNSLTDGSGGTAGWGALETQNRPYYTNAGDITGESTFVHEYTHQWFGDAVRIADWKSLWLNEGFATYVTHLYYEKTYGVSAQEKFKNLYKNKGENSLLWATAPADIKKESDLFGGPKVAYNRGALALAALREIVGDADFFKILKGWVAEKNGQAVKTQDFINYAQDEADADLSVWASEWLYGTTKPAAWPGEIASTPTIIPIINVDGGSIVTLPTLKVGEAIGALPTPTKAGYTFDGWYVNDVKIDEKFIVPSTLFTLVAKWAIVTSNTVDDDKPSNADGAPQDQQDQNPNTSQQIVAASIASAKVTAISDKVYTGKALTPAVSVTLSGNALVANTDYAVTYANNVKVGKAVVTVTGKGQYTGALAASFKIVPKAVSVKSLKAGKQKFTLAWKKATDVTKYQVRYKLASAKKWNTANVAAKATSKAVKKLKKGKKYQVQIRAYKTVSGTNYYSAWSKTKTVTAK